MGTPPTGVGVDNTVINMSRTNPGFHVPDPFGPRLSPTVAFLNAIMATAFFRCWHILLFFGAWSVLIAALNTQGYRLIIQPTLLTVIGTVLGFVISYRTTSSFERYNEGRRYWSQVVMANRTFARTTWFHVSDTAFPSGIPIEEQAARSLIEKKSVINLLEAFAVSLKHYLRGEDGIHYEDLYYLVKHLPGYALPAGRPSFTDAQSVSSYANTTALPASASLQRASFSPEVLSLPMQAGGELLSHPVTNVPRHLTFIKPQASLRNQSQGQGPLAGEADGKEVGSGKIRAERTGSSVIEMDDILLPAYMPSEYHLFDLFPFSLFVHWMTVRGRDVKGKKAARLRAKIGTRKKGKGREGGQGGGNLPLEISLYLSSYVASVQERKLADVPTANNLIFSLNQLVDALTGLERILTTPIPFSYAFHLWAVTVVYCLVLPFQIWPTLRWITVPATVIVCFMFFGFLVAGEEIENPFGYDKNDLNLDHFTHNIIRNELKALTSTRPPRPADWAFVAENDMLFAVPGVSKEAVPPEVWVMRGVDRMWGAVDLGGFPGLDTA